MVMQNDELGTQYLSVFQSETPMCWMTCSVAVVTEVILAKVSLT